MKNVLAPWETGEERQVKRRMKELGSALGKTGSGGCDRGFMLLPIKQRDRYKFGICRGSAQK